MSPEAERLVERLLADDLDAAGWDALLRLAEREPACAAYIDLHHALGEPDSWGELPAEDEFARVRAKVMDQIGAGGSHTPRAPFGQQVYALAAAALLVVVGAAFWAGTLYVGDARVIGSADSMLAELEAAALENRLIDDIENADLLLSDVSFDRRVGDNVELSFDVSRRYTVMRPVGDPLVEEAVVQSLVRAEDLGTRLRAIDVGGELPRLASDKVVQGLIFSMLNDAELAVRLRSLDILAEQSADPAIEEAFLTVLAAEESMQMRLRALDFLAANGRSGRVDQVVADLDPDSEMALLVRAGRRGLSR